MALTSWSATFAIMAILWPAVANAAATIAAGHHDSTSGDGRSHHGPSRPNVLYLLSDDLRADVHALSDSPTVTPNLDKLAARSLIFERAYCQPV